MQRLLDGTTKRVEFAFVHAIVRATAGRVPAITFDPSTVRFDLPGEVEGSVVDASAVADPEDPASAA